MFKKSAVIGVSVSPEMGLEIAQVDYASGTVLKYGRRAVEYSAVKREIADLDVFKDALQDLLEEMNIQKGSELVLNFPTVAFKVADYPSALEQSQVESAIEEELYDNPYLKSYEPCYSYIKINSTLQFNKYAYEALQKTTMIELVIALKEMGYKVSAIDTSVSSTLRSLIYLNRVNTEPDTNWVLLLIENGCCRVLSMLGRNYVDIFEEKISIGDVLSDAENYATVIAAVEPLLKNLPSKYLCVVSKTNVISAEVLSNKISYSAPIIYQEANGYLKEPLMNLSPLVEDEYSKTISLDVIGAAIYEDYKNVSLLNFNLFNKTLGDIFLNEQPPEFFGGKIVLSNPFLIFIGIIAAAVIAVIVVSASGYFALQNSQMNDEISQMKAEINKIDEFIEKHKDISTETFDEGDEIRIGLLHNKNIYSYYSIVGTEIPKKLWLTHLNLGDNTTIEGQADNIESVYSFFRSIKDYNPSSDISLQTLGLATAHSKGFTDGELDEDSLLTSLDADYYEFRISDAEDKSAQKKKTKKSKKAKKSSNSDVPSETIKE